MTMPVGTKADKSETKSAKNGAKKSSKKKTATKPVIEVESPSKTSLVLYAHPDKWTVNAEFPPEEQARMRTALLGFAWDWLGLRRSRVRVLSPKRLEVRDTEEQRSALARWNARSSQVTQDVLATALECVLCGALWESPSFKRPESSLKFHRAWRILLDIDDGARQADLETLTKRWKLIPRSR